MGNTVRAIMPGDIFTTSMTTRLLFLALPLFCSYWAVNFLLCARPKYPFIAAVIGN